MKRYGEYTKIIKNIDNMKEINKSASDVNQRYVRLLKVHHLEFFDEDPKGSIFMIVDVLDLELNKKEIAIIVYEPKNNTSSAIIMAMISSFLFGSADTHALDFIIEGSLMDKYFLRDIRLTEN